MKKIIYSLVIMIAAGSLFTSCIEQVEPLGIQDMRFAKAEYIRALKDLRAADAELVRAEAAHEQARARYVDAMTANLNADTEYQKLLNEYQALINEARQDTNDFIHNATLSAIDSLKKEIELRELKHAKDMADAEKALAQAREELRVALRNINLAAGDLTGPEKVALAEAVAVYYGLTEEVIKQEYNVFKAQQKVDTLTEYALRFSDTAWNGYALVDVDDYYEDAIAWEEAKIAKWMEDYEAIPDTAARVAEWKAYAESFDDAIDKINYEKAKIEANKTAIASFEKEGIRDFNRAIADFIEENWTEDPAGTFTEPTEPTKPGAEPKQSDYPAKNYLSDSLTFPVLAKADFSTTEQVIYDKFTFLLRSYKKDSPLSKAEPKNKMIYTQNDTVMFGPLGDKTYSGMKDFVLGARGNGENSQVLKDKNGNVKAKANYGLWGAYDILERELVVTPDEAPTEEEIAEAKKNMDKADSTWTAHRKILIDGVAKYVPFQEAEATLETEEEENGKGSAKMVQAIKDINTAFAAVAGQTAPSSFDGFDSTEFFKAIVDFAKAREEYLGEGYTAPADQDPAVEFNKADRSTWDKNLFYYSEGSAGTGKPIIASKKFSELTFDELKDGTYNKVIWDGDGLTEKGYAKLHGFYNILDQLLGEPFINVINPGSEDTKMAALSVTPTQAKAALYDVFDVKTSWADPKTIYKGTDPFTPADLVKAKNNVLKKINEYIKVYNDFWGLTGTEAKEDYTESTTAVKEYFEAMDGGVAETIAEKRAALIEAIEATCDKSKLDPACYTLNTFTKPYNVVAFSEGKVAKTDAISAILNSVDPTVKAKGDDYVAESANAVEAETAIFHGSATDFWKYMWFVSEYNRLTGTTVKDGLNTIKTWIEGVAGAYDADVAAAPGKATTAYNTAHSAWQTKKNTYDTKKAAYDVYEAAKKEFTGIRVEASGDTVINPVYEAAASYTKPIPATFLTEVKELFATNLVGEYVGWIETLGGEQLENAIEAFGEEPWEQYNEWKDLEAQYTAQITDLNALKDKAVKVYKAAAKLEGINIDDATTLETAYQNFLNTYNALRNAIVVYDEFGNIDMTNTTAKVNKAYQEIERLSHEAACYKSDVPDWEGLIAEAQKDLKVQEARLQSLKAACEYAKANYEKLKEYILSQDASYVIPVSVADIQSLLKGLGINVGDLLSEYLGLGEEEEAVVEP